MVLTSIFSSFSYACIGRRSFGEPAEHILHCNIVNDPPYTNVSVG